MEVMIDIETVSTAPNAAILTLGAVAFDSAGLHGEFYTGIRLEDCELAGLKIDAGTIKWWMKQPQEVMQAAFSGEYPLSIALGNFSRWYAVYDVKGVWGNGSDFDNLIPTNAFRAVGSTPPWTYKQNRCYRTLAALFPEIPLARQGSHHNALDDAKSQALHASLILKRIKVRDEDAILQGSTTDIVI